eukprot:IDg17952t1
MVTDTDTPTSNAAVALFQSISHLVPRSVDFVKIALSYEFSFWLLTQIIVIPSIATVYVEVSNCSVCFLIVGYQNKFCFTLLALLSFVSFSDTSEVVRLLQHRERATLRCSCRWKCRILHTERQGQTVCTSAVYDTKDNNCPDVGTKWAEQAARAVNFGLVSS